MYDLCRGVLRPHHRVTLTKAARLDLRAWQVLLRSFHGRSMLDSQRWNREPGITLETDAAGDTGIGAICGSAWLSGHWPEQLRDADICVKELSAVVIAISVWCLNLSNRCVIIRCDNSAVVHCIASQSSRSPAIMHWLRKLFVTTCLHNILVRAVHTPGSAADAADALSRGMIQVFRRLRPSANQQATSWDWTDYSPLQP